MKKILLTILIIIIPLLSFAQIATNDFGDAPESYGSADHYIDNLHYLGSGPDAEDSQQYSQEADADDLKGSDDEDGVTFPELRPGTSVTIQVSIIAYFTRAYLNAWIDWNGDGDFSDQGEKVANDVRRSTGNFNLQVNVPVNAIVSQPTFARFRFGPENLSSTGSVSQGEVEDYMIKILCVQVGQPKVGGITQPSCLLYTSDAADE